MPRKKKVTEQTAVQKPAKAAAPAEELRYIVSIRPGSAASAPLRFRLPEAELGKTVLDAIKYGLDKQHARSAGEIADSIRAEMRRDYGINVNSRTVRPAEKVKPLFEVARKDGITYMSLDTIVASKQTGGYQ